jgi:hypothetical protein
MRIYGDKRTIYSFILPTVKERKRERIGRYSEEPERGFKDKTSGDSRD